MSQKCQKCVFKTINYIYIYLMQIISVSLKAYFFQTQRSHSYILCPGSRSQYPSGRHVAIIPAQGLLVHVAHLHESDKLGGHSSLVSKFCCIPIGTQKHANRPHLPDVVLQSESVEQAVGHLLIHFLWQICSVSHQVSPSVTLHLIGAGSLHWKGPEQS